VVDIVVVTGGVLVVGSGTFPYTFFLTAETPNLKHLIQKEGRIRTDKHVLTNTSRHIHYNFHKKHS